MIDCNTAEKYIPYFLSDDLSINSLKAFLSHVETCPDCKEELSIQFLVTEALNALENDSNYDLQSAYDQRIAKAMNSIRFHKKLFWIRNFALVLVALALVGVAAYMYMMFFK